VPLGDVPFLWKTEGDEVVITGVEARPFGGRVTAEARVPAQLDGRPVQGVATVTGIDTARLASLVPGEGLKLTGTADGRVEFAVPTRGEPGGPAVQANVRLSAPNLTVQGIPAEGVAASVWVRQGVLNYEILAESLGGKIKFRGDVPLSAADRARAELTARLQAVGFRLDDLWRALGVAGAPTQLDGLGALDANLRAPLLRPADLAAHGLVEVRDLRWGRDYPLGQIRGTVALTPAAWKVESLRGELLGGQAQGSAWGETPPGGAARMGLELQCDRVDLGELLAFLPSLSDNVEGTGSLRLTGTLAEGLRANADVRVPQAQIFRVPLTDLRAPADVVYRPGGSGTLQVRRWTARLAGGPLRGSLRFGIGSDRAYQGELTLGDVDLEAIARVATEARNPATGRVSGRISWDGRDPAQLQTLRGRAELHLDDASLFELPVFREMSRFLGSAQGGLFEDGDLVATIANRQIHLEKFTLEGRVAQMHMAGTIGFNSDLDLAALVNTNQIIPQRGTA
jgi:translocation and assembly module TamB